MATKAEMVRILKHIKKLCKPEIAMNGDMLIRDTCILHKYFQSIGRKRTTMNECLGGEKPCTEIQRILGVDTRITHCPTIHGEIYKLVKKYKFPRNVKI